MDTTKLALRSFVLSLAAATSLILGSSSNLDGLVFLGLSGIAGVGSMALAINWPEEWLWPRISFDAPIKKDLSRMRRIITRSWFAGALVGIAIYYSWLTFFH